jgi:large subunit ribosomal protein L3
MLKEVIGTKIGMTQIFNEESELVAVTFIEVDPVCLVEKVSRSNKTKAKVGYRKVLKEQKGKVKKPIAGYFKAKKAPLHEKIKELELEDADKFEAKKEVGVEMFAAGDKVNVKSKSKGRGFQGGVKRHNWRGGKGSHGSRMHRRIGSVGATTYPGRILKGHSMPGHMGDKTTTVRNLEVVKVDKEQKGIFVKGAVPGANGSEVFVRKV